MGKNARKPVLSIRYRRPEKQFGVSLIRSSNSKNSKSKGRILSVKKVPREKILRVHEFLPFDTEALLREFREKEKQREVTKTYGQREVSSTTS